MNILTRNTLNVYVDFSLRSKWRGKVSFRGAKRREIHKTDMCGSLTFVPHSGINSKWRGVDFSLRSKWRGKCHFEERSDEKSIKNPPTGSPAKAGQAPFAKGGKTTVFKNDKFFQKKFSKKCTFFQKSLKTQVLPR